jgi:hypothetical protein
MLSVFLVVVWFHSLAVSNTEISDIKSATSPGTGESDGQVRRQGARVLLL